MENDESHENNSPPSSPVEETSNADTPATKSFGSSEKDWAMLTHLSGLACVVGLPNFIGPLIFWLIKKDEMPMVDRAGKEALNFQLTMFIVLILSSVLTLVFVGVITLLAAAVMIIIFSIIAGIEANKGNDYSYPLTIRFIK